MKNERQDTPAPHALGELAYEKLREAIRNGVFRPGDPVRERKVSDWLQVSRTPVRDAIRRLQNEGYLTHKLHHGVVVSSIDRKGVSDLYALREILEGAAAAGAARNATDTQIAALRRIVDVSARTRDVSELVAYNYQFHSIIHEASDNQSLVKTLNQVRESLVLVGRSTLVLSERPAQVLKEHRQILAMISKRDARGAEKAMRQHIRLALENRFRLQEQADLSNLPAIGYPMATGVSIHAKPQSGTHRPRPHRARS